VEPYIALFKCPLPFVSESAPRSMALRGISLT